MNERDEKIMNVLKTRADGMTTLEVSRATGFPLHNTGNLLKSLERYGFIEKHTEQRNNASNKLRTMYVWGVVND